MLLFLQLTAAPEDAVVNVVVATATSIVVKQDKQMRSSYLA